MRLLLPSLILGTAGAVSELNLDVNLKDGNFQITLGGQPWLDGSEYRVGDLSSTAGSLNLLGSDSTDGTDILGAYQATSLKWGSSASGNTLMETTFRHYKADSGFIVFEQHFPAGADLQSLSQSSGADQDSCRLVTGDFELTKSKSGYSAWTGTDGTHMKSQPGQYCGDGKGNHAKEAWHMNGISQKDCLDKCLDLVCKCADYRASPAPPPSTLAARTLFPTFKRPSKDSSSASLSCFAYHGTFPSMKPCTLSTYTESSMGGSPLVIYDASDKSLPMAVFSPLNQPMAHHMAHTSDFIGAGVKATVDTIPAGWRQSFLLSADAGINKGMMTWGSRLLKFTGRPVVDNRYLDDVHGSIGFWTDNGGFYHYSIGKNASLGKNYEEVLQKVKAYHDELGVPFKHWQFDSWFYPKDGGVSPGGGGGAVTNWTALDSVFPHGMKYIQEKLGLPMVMHNRQWSTRSDYIHNWTDIEWYSSKKAAVPKDPVKFFDRFFTQQEGWGLSMYEQDWMVTEYGEVDALQTNISMGDLWLYGMAEGAARSKRTVQYCMPTPYEVLSASYLPAVTNARATGDYFHSKNQWAVGQTSLFYWALNILPFKDGFYSSNNKQVGGQTEGPEMHPDRETIMATLSTAMVGPMDGIYLLNASRVMTTCRGDGKILKPDRPITPPDTCFTDGTPTCFVYTTESNQAKWGRITYYYNDAGSSPMTAAQVDLESAAGKGTYAVYNWYSGELSLLEASNSLTPGYEGHTYAVVAPIKTGWAFIGEVNKYTVASNLRFSNIGASDKGLSADVEGVKGETVKVCATQAKDLKLICKELEFKDNGSQTVSFAAEDAMLMI